MYGYGGEILRIDLSERRFRREKIKKSWIKPVIGGRAANTKRLCEGLDPACDPLGPENLLIFGTGPLTGSLLPASAYFTVTAKSPLTGILGDSAAGGQFGAALKRTGCDQVIITGKMEELGYLMITDEDIGIVACPEYRGKSILETTASIRKRYRDHSIEVAAIGPAGEKMVQFSTIVSSGNRVNGRTGMGAVMGSKNIKAVAVTGTRSVEVADTITFLSLVGEMEEAIRRHPEYEKRYRLGTTMLMKDLNGLGILPTNHFQQGVCSYVDGVSGETLAEKYKVKNKACFNCNLHCSRYYRCNGAEAEGPEFETLCSFTSRLGNDDLAFALEMNAYLNQMGLDSISTGEIIGWIIECQERGLLSPADLDGVSISWGEIKRKYVRW
jgi:aldehyde:ferredoxin oxidoreductase